MQNDNSKSKNWVIAKQKSNDIIDQLLINRGISLKDKERFLNPNYERDLHDPFLLKDMNKAVKRIIQAINNKETIGIFADYDADGIPGAVILATFFNHLKVKNEVYIPSREEGYGLNETGILDLYEKGCKLVITVDLGITGKAQVEFAKKLGVDMIVTDHHLIQKDKIPDQALAVIHPQLSPKYPNKDLSGGAVAWKLVCGLISKLKAQNEKLKALEKWLLDLAAISLVCDLVPLKGENRTMVKYGMKVLAKTKNIGLDELMNIAGVDRSKISTYTLGWQIGPRVNAPGRLDHGQISYFLLTTRNREETRKLAKKLNTINQERQDELERVLQQAKEKINQKKLEQNKVILIYDKHWPEGVIGLVAGKLMEELHRPVIIFKETDEGLKGSARSIEKFHILNALSSSKEFLVKYGGHARAAGLNLKKENFANFYNKLLVLAEKDLRDKDLLPQIKIDALLDIRHQTIDDRLIEIGEQRAVSSKKRVEMGFQISDIRTLASDLRTLEPFGMGNPRPVFLTKRLAISDLRFVGKDSKHLKLKLTANSYKLKADFDTVLFNCPECHKSLKKGDVCDIVYIIEENEWQGSKTIQLNILDLRGGNISAVS